MILTEIRGRSSVQRALSLLFLFIVIPCAAQTPPTTERPAPRPLCSSVSAAFPDPSGFAKGLLANATGREKVNIIYLVPSDKQEQARYRTAMEGAAVSLRLWYRDQMGNGKTFNSSVPPVRVLRTSHPASFYSTNPNGDTFITFWNNVLADGFALTGGKFNDPENIWAFYIDADPRCGQCGGCGTSGVLVVPANDLRGLAGEPTTSSCAGEQPDNAPPSRWIGGLGHELGHAFGLPHPPGCDAGAPGCDYNALMWNGFRSYPNAYLRDDEKALLNASPFFHASSVARCTPDATTLCLNNNRFRVSVSWRVPTQSGEARAVPMTNDTGYFWFFNRENVELVVKALDGRPVNGRWWIFFGALSNVEYTLRVTDTETGGTKTYLNPEGRFASVGDTTAFSVGPGPDDAATPQSVAQIAGQPETADSSARKISLRLPLATCSPNSTTLCLNGNRFQVRANWRAQNQSGAGVAVPLTSDTGYFWFFNNSNVELVLKALDGRGVNGKWWVFYGALSDVEYTIEVIDTVTGTVKSYRNESGRFASVGDTEAFAAGPSGETQDITGRYSAGAGATTQNANHCVGGSWTPSAAATDRESIAEITKEGTNYFLTMDGVGGHQLPRLKYAISLVSRDENAGTFQFSGSQATTGWGPWCDNGTYAPAAAEGTIVITRSGLIRRLSGTLTFVSTWPCAVAPGECRGSFRDIYNFQHAK